MAYLFKAVNNFYSELNITIHFLRVVCQKSFALNFVDAMGRRGRDDYYWYFVLSKNNIMYAQLDLIWKTLDSTFVSTHLFYHGRYFSLKSFLFKCDTMEQFVYILTLLTVKWNIASAIASAIAPGIYGGDPHTRVQKVVNTWWKFLSYMNTCIMYT